MSLMGKIFTLLIFFMSICFLVISVMVGATHRNWKQTASDMQKNAQASQTRLNSAKDDTNKQLKLLAAERVSRAMQLSQLESQLKRAQEDFKTVEAQYRKSIEISQARLTELESVTNRIKQQDSEIEDLKANNTKLVDDIAAQFQNVTNLTNQTFVLQNEIVLLKQKRAVIAAQLASSTRVLKANGLTQNDLIKHIVPKLDGVVTQVGADGLFAVQLGTDDGVREDHVFDVYRRDRFIGKGTVIRTEEDICVLKVVADFMKDSVREGDHVTSKL